MICWSQHIFFSVKLSLKVQEPEMNSIATLECQTLTWKKRLVGIFSLAILASPNGRLVKSSARIPPSKKVKADSEALEEALEESQMFWWITYSSFS